MVVFKSGNGENAVRLTSIKMEACIHLSIYRLVFEVTRKIQKFLDVHEKLLLCLYVSGIWQKLIKWMQEELEKLERMDKSSASCKE
jgi:hypothetical protein